MYLLECNETSSGFSRLFGAHSSASSGASVFRSVTPFITFLPLQYGQPFVSLSHDCFNESPRKLYSWLHVLHFKYINCLVLAYNLSGATALLSPHISVIPSYFPAKLLSKGTSFLFAVAFASLLIVLFMFKPYLLNSLSNSPTISSKLLLLLYLNNIS